LPVNWRTLCELTKLTDEQFAEGVTSGISLKNRDPDSLPLCAADRILGTALTVRRDESEHLIGCIDNLLVSGVITPRNLALAFRAGEVRPKYLGREPALACGLLRPTVWARGAAGYDDGVRRKASNEVVDRISVSPAARAHNGDMSQRRLLWLSSP
jgi:hypothetical protein